MFAAMDPSILFVLLFLASLFVHSFSMEVQSSTTKSSSAKITVMGLVYCDICSNNTFSRHSYFLPGVKVHLNCKFKATSPTTTTQMSFSVNRTTDKFGIYRMEIPSLDGIKCAEGLSVESLCEASLIGSSTSSCSIPGLKTTTDGMTIKSKKANLCIYSLNALNYRPPKRNITLCGKHKQGGGGEGYLPGDSSTLNSSKFFFPFFPPFFPPPFGFPFPPFPFPFPFYPPMTPFPSFPFPPMPPFPFPPMSSFPFPPMPPFPFPPMSSFPFPPMPPFPFPPMSSFPFPPMPPSLPFPFPPLPPASSLFSPSPPPPGFNLRDPRTWVPFVPPSSFSPHTQPQNHQQQQHP